MKIGIIGLGYVGLPLAIEFSKHFKVVGFDLNKNRVDTLSKGDDYNNEYKKIDIINKNLNFTSNEMDLEECNFFIICVPTPIDENNSPDLDAIKKACIIVGRAISPGSYVVLESTVYPGVTEDICVPIIEEISQADEGREWHIGYSPERVNPGDTEHTIDKITKVVSGSSPKALKFINKIYSKICPTYMAPTIRTAESAKVIENIQRDVNIALVNELSCIFRRLSIDTQEVLKASRTKWNFLDFKPGLVGGHCISVDPYYLAQKAQEVRYMPEMILSGRRVNESMSSEVVQILVDELNFHKKPVNGSKILILGASFKPNIKDTRNSKVEDIIGEIEHMGGEVLLHDPFMKIAKFNSFSKPIEPLDAIKKVDAIIIATGHSKFKKITRKWMHKVLKQDIIIDIPNLLESPNTFKL